MLAAAFAILAYFKLGGDEIILILAVVAILFGATQLPELARGLALGLDQFGKSAREVRDEIDEAASDAGRSLGGIYGKPAAQAITPDNQLAELYDPAVLGEKRLVLNTPRNAARGLVHFLFGTSRSRFISVTLLTVGMVALVITCVRPVLEPSLKGSPKILWIVYVLIGTTTALVVCLAALRWIRSKSQPFTSVPAPTR